MAISKHSFPSTSYRFAYRQTEIYSGDDIPTRRGVESVVGIGLQSARHAGRVPRCTPDGAGKVFLMIIMVILMINILLHHRADDYNHMGMQAALQLSFYERGS